jgi:RNA polymerase-binding transcription factor DksA
VHYHYFTLEQRDSLEQVIRSHPGSEDLLKRLHSAEYGVCAACGGDIPYARLLRSPAALLCPDCDCVGD